MSRLSCSPPMRRFLGRHVRDFCECGKHVPWPHCPGWEGPQMVAGSRTRHFNKQLTGLHCFRAPVYRACRKAKAYQVRHTLDLRLMESHQDSYASVVQLSVQRWLWSSILNQTKDASLNLLTIFTYLPNLSPSSMFVPKIEMKMWSCRGMTSSFILSLSLIVVLVAGKGDVTIACILSCAKFHWHHVRHSAGHRDYPWHRVSPGVFVPCLSKGCSVQRNHWLCRGQYPGHLECPWHSVLLRVLCATTDQRLLQYPGQSHYVKTSIQDIIPFFTKEKKQVSSWS